MKCTLYNLEQLERVVDEIKKDIQDGKFVNIDYGNASKPKTKAQTGFFFSALSSQIRDYLTECGFVVDDKDVRYYLYKKVSEIVPEIISDCGIFGKEPRIKHLDEYDRATMSKFIDGVFLVLSQENLFAGIKLTPDVYFNWVNHITDEELQALKTADVPERDNSYLDYRRSQPCIICGIQHRSEAHHLKDMRLCGLTQKAPDWATVSLCTQCHRNIAHGTGFMESLKWIPFDLVDFCKMCYLRWQANI